MRTILMCMLVASGLACALSKLAEKPADLALAAEPAPAPAEAAPAEAAPAADAAAPAPATP